MESPAHAEHVLNLHELVTGTADVQGILQGVTGFASNAITRVAGAPIDCALTLRRRKRAETVAGSSDKAVLLDRIEQGLGQGPCLDALNAGRPVLLDDTETDTSWPAFSRAATAEGCRSVLGVPMDLGGTSEAVLNFFASKAGLFTNAVVDEAAVFADVTGRTLRLAIRLETAEQLYTDLKTAMTNRTVIDLACGVIMSQNRCSKDEAFQVLVKASSHRNEKLHTVAADIIARMSGSTDSSLHFQE